MINVQDKVKQFGIQFCSIQNKDHAQNMIQMSVNKKQSIIKSMMPANIKLIDLGQALEHYKNLVRKYQKIKGRQKINWKLQQIQLLFFMILNWLFKNQIDLQNINQLIWARISAYLYLRTPFQCKIKFLSNIKHTKPKPLFNSYEHLLLQNIFNQINIPYKNIRWTLIAVQFNKLSNYTYRSAKELKKYWIKNICSKQLGNWSASQDLILFEYIYEFGKKWSKISNLMNNTRTQFAVKNRYFTVVRKYQKQKLIDKQSQKEINITIKILKKLKQKQDLQSKQQQRSDDKSIYQNANSLIDQTTPIYMASTPSYFARSINHLYFGTYSYIVISANLNM